MNKVITISRQYASGGRTIGRQLADYYGIPFYDNDLITLAAKESGFTERIFNNAEEKASNSLIYSIAMGLNAFGAQGYGADAMSIDDRVFLAQSDIIRKVASEGPCVIIGRCADYVLREKKNVVNIFVWSDISSRIQRAVNEYGMPQPKAEENILKVDKKRANYYNYHSDKRWGRADSYNLTIKSDDVGIDNAVNCIRSYIEAMK